MDSHKAPLAQPGFRPVVKPPQVHLQRACACGNHTHGEGECESCRQKGTAQLQRSALQGSLPGAAPPVVHQALASPGQTLEAGTRRQMERLLGHDFSRVRLHTGENAARSAQAVHARAYTVGEHLVFGAGQYAPRTSSGRRLLAHELAHVVQQKGAQPGLPENLGLSHPGDPAEQEANRVAARAFQAPGVQTGGEAGGEASQRPGAQVRQARPASLVQRDLLPGDPATLVGPGLGFAASAAASAAAGAAAGVGAAALPYVTIGNFRNSGTTNAAENNCPLCLLPLGLLPGSGKNRMELRGDISGHVAGAQYDFKRTKERATWKKVGDSWTQITHVGPGADDDSHDQDESLTPVNNHIYVEDGPGFRRLANPVGDASATEAVYKASFVETCNVKVGAGPWRRSSNSFAWHSISWLEKVGGAWGRAASWNEIGPNSTYVGKGSPYGLGDFPLPTGGTQAA